MPSLTRCRFLGFQTHSFCNEIMEHALPTQNVFGRNDTITVHLPGFTGAYNSFGTLSPSIVAESKFAYPFVAVTAMAAQEHTLIGVFLATKQRGLLAMM